MQNNRPNLDFCRFFRQILVVFNVFQSTYGSDFKSLSVSLIVVPKLGIFELNQRNFRNKNRNVMVNIKRSNSISKLNF